MQSSLLKSKHNVEWLLVGFTLLIGSLMFWWVSNLDLARSLTDQNAHLNAARLTVNSMTPGISQIGFWPPLLHVLMVPFVLIQNFYISGAAGAVVLIPFLAIAAIFLYRLTILFTQDKFLGVVAALLLVLNPYILYYSVTPMMEVLFIANLFGVAYFLAMWLKEDKLKYLLFTGLFVSLACLSRFEGLILLPLCGLIVLIQVFRKRKGYSEIEALMLLFGILASLGLGAIVIYSWIFSGDPFTFTGGSWLRNPAEATFPTKHDLFGSFKYMLYASFYMLTKPLVMISAISFVIFALVSRMRFSAQAVLAVLVSPFVFIATTLYTGTGSIAVADLPPYNFFSNERYSLTWIGFVILVPILLIGILGLIMYRSKRNWVAYSGILLRNVLAITLLAFGAYQLYNVSFVQKFEVIKQNINSPLPSQIEVYNYLKSNYDYGKILITKADNDPILAQGNVPLKNYIYEGNYRYFDQTNDEPWLFARYVIMHNPEDGDAWAQSNEAVMNRWGNNERFAEYYTLVLENSQRRVYKVDEAKLISMAQENNLDIAQIPSINRSITWWDPTDIYSRIASTAPDKVTADVKKN